MVQIKKTQLSTQIHEFAFDAKNAARWYALILQSRLRDIFLTKT